MINLILAILFSTCIMVAFKLFERFRIDIMQAISINYMIAVISSLILYNGDLSPGEVVNLPWLGYGIAIGLFFIIVFFIFATSAAKVGIAITAVSSKMSVIIPVLVGILLLKNDVLTWVKIIGILTALIAFYLTFKNDKPLNIKKRYFFLPLLLFAGSGLNDSMQSYTTNIYQINTNNQTTLLLTVIFGTAMLAGIAISLWQVIFKGSRIYSRNIVAGIILGLLNYFSTYFFLRSLDIFPNSFFFPVFNASIVTLAALIGYFVFREKLRLINWAGIILAIAAIIIITLGN